MPNPHQICRVDLGRIVDKGILKIVGLVGVGQRLQGAPEGDEGAGVEVDLDPDYGPLASILDEDQRRAHRLAVAGAGGVVVGIPDLPRANQRQAFGCHAAAHLAPGHRPHDPHNRALHVGQIVDDDLALRADGPAPGLADLRQHVDDSRLLGLIHRASPFRPGPARGPILRSRESLQGQIRETQKLWAGIGYLHAVRQDGTEDQER